MKTTVSLHSLPSTLKDALDVVENYTPAGLIEKLTLKYESPPTHPDSEAKGRYDHSTKTIYVSPNSRHPGMTFLHELGHAVDAHLEGYEKTMPSADTYYPVSSAFQAWQKLLRGDPDADSDLGRVLLAITRTPQFSQHIKKIEASSNPRVKADKDMSEFFARSYCQYVIERSQRPQLLIELKAALDRPEELDRLLQWPSDDFVPIAAAYDELMRS